MVQVARNVAMEEWGFLSPGQYLIHDRDGKYCPPFQQIIVSLYKVSGKAHVRRCRRRVASTQASTGSHTWALVGRRAKRIRADDTHTVLAGCPPPLVGDMPHHPDRVVHELQGKRPLLDRVSTPHDSWRVVSHPRTTLRLRRWETPVDDHDGNPLCPRLLVPWGTRYLSLSVPSATPPSRHRTPAAQASLTSFHPPYAWEGSTATRFPRRAACRASACHCCCPAVSASKAKTSAPTSGPSPSASHARHRSPRPEAHLQPAAPAHQRRLRTPTAARSLPATPGR